MIEQSLPKLGEGKRGGDGYFGYLLRQAANSYKIAAERILDESALTQPQFMVLTILNAYPGYSNADLARVALLTPQTMSVIVANLLKAKLIERHAHAFHGRIQNLCLTQAGFTRLNKAKEEIGVLEKNMTLGLSASDQKLIKKWLVTVALL